MATPAWYVLYDAETRALYRHGPEAHASEPGYIRKPFDTVPALNDPITREQLLQWDRVTLDYIPVPVASRPPAIGADAIISESIDDLEGR